MHVRLATLLSWLLASVTPGHSSDNIGEEAPCPRNSPAWALRLRVQGRGSFPADPRVYQRLEWRNSDVRLFVLTERDPGESRWADHVSAHLKLGYDEHRLVIGDLRPGFAQGLLFARSTRRSVTTSIRRDSEFLGYRSAGENHSLRGVALRSRRGSLDGTLLIGRAWRDGRLGDDGQIRSMPEAGEHISATQLAGRDLFKAWAGAVRVRQRSRRVELGMTLIGLRFNRLVDFRRAGRVPWAFTGRGQLLCATDVRVLTSALRMAAEIGADSGGRVGAVAVARTQIERLRFLVLGRYYAPGFQSFFGAPATSWTMNNELGLLFSVAARLRTTAWSITRDSFADIQASQYRPVPRQTRAWLVRTVTLLNDGWKVRTDLRLRRRTIGASRAVREVSRQAKLAVSQDRGRNLVSAGVAGQYLSQDGQGQLGGVATLIGVQIGRVRASIRYRCQFASNGRNPLQYFGLQLDRQ